MLRAPRLSRPSLSLSKPPTPLHSFRRTFAEEGSHQKQELLVEGTTPRLNAGRKQRFRSLADDIDEMFGKEGFGVYDSVVPGELFGFRNTMINQLNHKILGSIPSGTHPDWEPHSSMFQNKEAVIVCVELPGVEKDDIKIELEEGGVLIVQGEKKSMLEKDNKVYEQEVETGKFYRAFPLPDHVDLASPKAEFKNGVLKVSFARTEVETESREIPIEDG